MNRSLVDLNLVLVQHVFNILNTQDIKHKKSLLHPSRQFSLFLFSLLVMVQKLLNQRATGETKLMPTVVLARTTDQNLLLFF